MLTNWTYRLKIKSQVLLAFCFCLFASIIQSQTKYVDSISQLIELEKSDTLRIDLLVKKIYRLNQIDLEEALIQAKAALTEAERIDYKNGQANMLTNMASNYSTSGDYVLAKKCLSEADSLAEILENQDLIGSIYSGFGVLYGVQSKYDSATVYFKKSIDIYEKTNNKISLGRSYGNIAIGYQMQSNFPQALYYQQKSLKLSEESKNITSQAYTWMNMGNTYQKMGDTLKSEQSFLKGIDIAKSQELKNVELYGYTNISSLYYIQKKWDLSYEYAMQATDLGESMGDTSVQAASMAKAALALMQTKKYKEAEALATSAITIADAAAQPLTIYQAYSSLGIILEKQEKFKQAIPLLEKSLNTLKNAELYDENMADTYASLSLCYEKIGIYKKALSSYKNSAQITDSIRRSENIRKATELSMTYDFDKKQAIAKVEQDQKDLEAKRARNRQLFIIAILGILGLAILIIALILYKNNKQKQLTNAHLERQKQRAVTALSKLKLTQKQLVQSEKMASLGELTAGIAHEIQNPLNFVNNFSEVSKELIVEMLEELKNGNTEEVNELANGIFQNLEKINHHGKRADNIVKGMLQHSRTSSGVKEATNINVLTDEYLRLAYHGLRAKDKSFNASMETDYDAVIGNINVIPQDLGRVILNLITNAFYAINDKRNQMKNSSSKMKYEPTLYISTKKENANILISVKDNGNGIPQKVLDKIFQPFFTTKPTGEGTGLGLSMSYDIVKAHGGNIKVNTKEGEGCEFIIQLPIKDA